MRRLVGTHGYTATGRWLDHHVWRGQSITATGLTDMLDWLSDSLQRHGYRRLACEAEYLVAVLGTGNYFGGRVADARDMYDAMRRRGRLR